VATSKLSRSEYSSFQSIVDDLNLLFNKNSIDVTQITKLKKKLNTSAVSDYLDDLEDGALPESALREELTAGQSVFTNHIFGKLSPEVTTSDGYVDYRVRGDEPIALELKSAFTQKTNAEDDITSLEFNHIDWRNHQEQVEKYRTNSRFTILTNLKEWYFFKRIRNRSTTSRMTSKSF